MSGIDRLSELRGRNETDDDDEDDRRTRKPTTRSAAKEGKDGREGREGADDIADHMKRYDAIKKGLETIKGYVAAVDRLKAKNKTTANEKTRKEIMNQLDDIMTQTNQQATLIKKTLDDIKAENSKYSRENKESAKAQMRNNLYQTHIRRFHQVMNDYNSSAHAFKQDLQKRTRREIKIVNPDISEQEIDNIVDSGRANDVIKQALISDSLQDVVRVIEERHLDILKLERQVTEIYELFKDLATLVDLQQESLDVIENRIITARNYTEKAEVELHEAEDYQKKARQKRCFLLLCLLVILVVILAPILATKLKNA